jgi:hypothetical protein
LFCGIDDCLYHFYLHKRIILYLQVMLNKNMYLALEVDTMDGGEAARGAYQRVRERLVGLTVELEDAERSAVLLDDALDRVRDESKEELERLGADMRAALATQEASDKAALSEVCIPCFIGGRKREERVYLSRFNQTNRRVVVWFLVSLLAPFERVAPFSEVTTVTLCLE